MGGLVLLAGGLTPVLLGQYRSADVQLLAAVVLTTLAFGAIGFADDLLIVLRGRNLGLRAREKLAAQLVVALVFAIWFYFYSARFEPMAAPLSPGRLARAAFHVLLLVGMSNAVNLTDGLDGLAAGVTLPLWGALALLAAFGPMAGTGITSDYGVIAFSAAFAGATLGYLWYNAHPAQVFMGDTGSLAIGGGLAATAIALRVEWLFLLAALVPVAEALSVVLQVISFKTTGRRIFRMSPLHHHFELCDWPETRIVVRFAIASSLAAGAALLLALGG